MKKLNIAIVHDNLTHLIDGSIISTLRFAEYLKKRGHKIIFITGKPRNNKKDVDELTKGDEAGILFEGNIKIEKGDVLVAYIEERKKGEL